MKRYTMAYEGGHNGELMEDAEGDWVRYEDAAARIAQLEASLSVRERHYHAAAALHSGDGRRIAQLEDELAMLIHPHDLAAYRAKKTLHK